MDLPDGCRDNRSLVVSGHNGEMTRQGGGRVAVVKALMDSLPYEKR